MNFITQNIGKRFEFFKNKIRFQQSIAFTILCDKCPMFQYNKGVTTEYVEWTILASTSQFRFSFVFFI